MRNYPAIESLIEQCGQIDAANCGGRDEAQRAIMLARLALERAQSRLSRYPGKVDQERANELLSELASAAAAVEVCTALIVSLHGNT